MPPWCTPDPCIQISIKSNVPGITRQSKMVPTHLKSRISRNRIACALWEIWLGTAGEYEGWFARYAVGLMMRLAFGKMVASINAWCNSRLYWCRSRGTRGGCMPRSWICFAACRMMWRSYDEPSNLLSKVITNFVHYIASSTVLMYYSVGCSCYFGSTGPSPMYMVYFALALSSEPTLMCIRLLPMTWVQF